MRSTAPSVSVVVPTYRRPGPLERCLAALRAQEHAPDETIVVHRADDDTTVALLDGVRAVVVDRPGVVAAMTAGARSAGGELIAFLDDDTEPTPGWLGACLAHLADPRVGAVSGRDVVEGEEHDPPELDPGRISSWGRMRGNHHLGTGPPRDVQVLKAANLVFRREALAFPEGLRGNGAQTHFEVAVCLNAVSRGWRLIYDPTIHVRHRAAARPAGEGRHDPSPAAVSDASYNLVRSICATQPRLTARRAAYGVLIGDRAVPGVGRAAVAALRGDRALARRLAPSLRGQLAALRDCASAKPFPFADVFTER